MGSFKVFFFSCLAYFSLVNSVLFYICYYNHSHITNSGGVVPFCFNWAIQASVIRPVLTIVKGRNSLKKTQLFFMQLSLYFYLQKHSLLSLQIFFLVHTEFFNAYQQKTVFSRSDGCVLRCHISNIYRRQNAGSVSHTLFLFLSQSCLSSFCHPLPAISCFWLIRSSFPHRIT